MLHLISHKILDGDSNGVMMTYTENGSYFRAGCLACQQISCALLPIYIRNCPCNPGDHPGSLSARATTPAPGGEILLCPPRHQGSAHLSTDLTGRVRLIAELRMHAGDCGSPGRASDFLVCASTDWNLPRGCGAHLQSPPRANLLSSARLCSTHVTYVTPMQHHPVAA